MAGTHRSSMQEGIPVKRNDATYVRLCGIQRLHGEWLLLTGPQPSPRPGHPAGQEWGAQEKRRTFFIIISSFHVFIDLSVSLSLALSLSLSFSPGLWCRSLTCLSLSLLPSLSTSAHSLVRISPPVMFELIYIYIYLSLSLSLELLPTLFVPSLPLFLVLCLSCLPSVSLYHSEGRRTIHKEEAKGVRETTKETRRKSRSAEGEREP